MVLSNVGIEAFPVAVLWRGAERIFPRDRDGTGVGQASRLSRQATPVPPGSTFPAARLSRRQWPPRRERALPPTRPRQAGGRPAAHGTDPARRRRTVRTVGASG